MEKKNCKKRKWVVEFGINNTISYCMTKRCNTKTCLCSILGCWYISVLVLCAISVNCQLKKKKKENCIISGISSGPFFFTCLPIQQMFLECSVFHQGSLLKSSELMREVMTTTRDSTKRAMTQAYAPRQSVVYCLLLLLFIVKNALQITCFFC